jgi:Uma2 family endonuclease
VVEGLFAINPKGEPERRPDVAFVSYARWPRERRVPSANTWEVVPDLAVEVVSPSNRAVEVLGKVREYFQAGVLRVWLVYPTERLVYIYESPMRNHVLGLNDTIDGGDPLPGFRLAVADLFDNVVGAVE